MRIKSLTLITGNEGKAKEFKELLALPDLDFRHHNLDLQELQSADIQEIGHFKAKVALVLLPELETDAVLTDDTGLYFEALNGLPGPLIKFFLKSLDLNELYGLTSDKTKAAKAVCQLSLGMKESKEVLDFQGSCPGSLVLPRGEEDFGWDKIFQPDGHSQTYAEMSLEEKNLISHRALAVQALREWIQG